MKFLLHEHGYCICFPPLGVFLKYRVWWQTACGDAVGEQCLYVFVWFGVYIEG